MSEAVSADQDADTASSGGFEAIVAADALGTTVDVIGAIVDEARIHLTQDGIEIRAVDPANVAMDDITLSAAGFESYQAPAEDDVIGVDVTRLDEILGLANADDLVHLDLDEETRKLHIQIGGLSYTLALIDPGSIRAEPDIPDLDLSADLVVEAAELDRGATAADLVSDHIRYRADPDERAFVIEAEGDTDDVEVTVGREDLIDADVAEAADSLFSLDYIKDFLKPMDGDWEVRIELGTEFPVKWHYQFAGGAGEVTTMLAPRIQSD